MKFLASNMLISLQCALPMIALVVLAMWPPASGDMLLVPLANSDINRVATMALAAGAALRGAGPFPGSLVVVGDRSSIARQFRSWDVVIIAAPPAGCGASGSA